MTSKKAIEWLREIQAQVFNMGMPEWTVSVELAIEALEKQIPKRVAFTVDRTWGIESKQPVCPVCDCYLAKTEFFGDGEKITYCDNCGQAIDRTEDNE